MKKTIFLLFGLFICCTIFASCSKDDNFLLDNIISTDTIINRDTTIIHDTIINPNDSTGKNDTIIKTDTIIKSDTIIKTDTVVNPEYFVNTSLDSIIVVHWNIGHFSNGTSLNTKITSADYVSKRDAYISLIDSINADLLGICEYNPEFSVEGVSARDSIFGMFNYASIGPKYQYNCNAVFSKKIPFYNEKNVSFKPSVQNRYYRSVDIYINNHRIKFVETHLDWNQGVNGAAYRKSQIENLINDFQNDKYVILCADYNVDNISEFDAFREAGYTLSNGGYFGTFLTAAAIKPTAPIDNIIVKGLIISNVRVFAYPNLSDHCIMQCTITE